LPFHCNNGYTKGLQYYVRHKVEVKVRFTLEQATKGQRGRRCIALLFLKPRR